MGNCPNWCVFGCLGSILFRSIFSRISWQTKSTKNHIGRVSGGINFSSICMTHNAYPMLSLKLQTDYSQGTVQLVEIFKTSCANHLNGLDTTSWLSLTNGSLWVHQSCNLWYGSVYRQHIPIYHPPGRQDIVHGPLPTSLVHYHPSPKEKIN